jgi:hypothetical protein
MSIDVKAATNMKIEAANTLELKATSININASGPFEAKGAQAKVEGSGTAELSSGGQTTVRGSTIAIN